MDINELKEKIFEKLTTMDSPAVTEKTLQNLKQSCKIDKVEVFKDIFDYLNLVGTIPVDPKKVLFDVLHDLALYRPEDKLFLTRSGRYMSALKNASKIKSEKGRVFAPATLLLAAVSAILLAAAAFGVRGLFEDPVEKATGWQELSHIERLGSFDHGNVQQ